MAKPRKEGSSILARLIHVDFPRMQVEYRGRPVDTLCLIEQPTCHAVGKETEIAAARGRHVDPKNANRSKRHLNHTLDRRERSAGRARAAVEIMFARIHAGTVEKAFF